MRNDSSNASLWVSAMRKSTADRLIVAFNFPPFTDGSAVTVAKRIVEADVPVDVVSADLSAVRSRDESLVDLVAPWLVEHHTVKVPVLFADERSLVPFVERGLIAVRQRRGRPYEEVYSRSMWPHSHFLAARLRSEGDAHRWIAEFSDPILWHADATLRPSGAVSLSEQIFVYSAQSDHAPKHFFARMPQYFAWAQFVPFLLADELVFTNEQQLQVMLNDAPEWMRAGVESRATISPHPDSSCFTLQSRKGLTSAVAAGSIFHWVLRNLLPQSRRRRVSRSNQSAACKPASPHYLGRIHGRRWPSPRRRHSPRGSR